MVEREMGISEDGTPRATVAGPGSLAGVGMGWDWGSGMGFGIWDGIWDLIQPKHLPQPHFKWFLHLSLAQEKG